MVGAWGTAAVILDKKLSDQILNVKFMPSQDRKSSIYNCFVPLKCYLAKECFQIRLRHSFDVDRSCQPA